MLRLGFQLPQLLVGGLAGGLGLLARLVVLPRELGLDQAARGADGGDGEDGGGVGEDGLPGGLDLGGGGVEEGGWLVVREAWEFVC